MIVFDIPTWQFVQFAIAVVLPVLVGFVTTRATDPGLKAALLLLLSLVSSLLTELLSAIQTGQVYNAGLALLLALGSFVTGVAMHYGLYKPAGIADVAADHLRTSPPLDRGGYTPTGPGGVPIVHHGAPQRIYTPDELNRIVTGTDRNGAEIPRESSEQADDDDDEPKHRAEPAP